MTRDEALPGSARSLLRFLTAERDERPAVEKRARHTATVSRGTAPIRGAPGSAKRGYERKREPQLGDERRVRAFTENASTWWAQNTKTGSAAGTRSGKRDAASSATLRFSPPPASYAEVRRPVERVGTYSPLKKCGGAISSL